MDMDFLQLRCQDWGVYLLYQIFLAIAPGLIPFLIACHSGGAAHIDVSLGRDLSYDCPPQLIREYSYSSPINLSRWITLLPISFQLIKNRQFSIVSFVLKGLPERCLRELHCIIQTFSRLDARTEAYLSCKICLGLAPGLIPFLIALHSGGAYLIENGILDLNTLKPYQ